MKTKPGFKARKLGRETILIAEGEQMVNFNRMIALNDTAAYLWESVQGKDFTAEDLKDLLLEKYDVDPDTALKDSEKIAQEWIKAEIAEP